MGIRIKAAPVPKGDQMRSDATPTELQLQTLGEMIHDSVLTDDVGFGSLGEMVWRIYDRYKDHQLTIDRLDELSAAITGWNLTSHLRKAGIIDHW